VDFPEKNYGDYVFPEGNYRALRIVLGEGNGQNWWCVMYPNMCFSGSVYETVTEDADEALKEVLSEEEYRRIIFSGNYEIRSGALDFLFNLKNKYYKKTS
jgi:stage II sporulation protein R